MDENKTNDNSVYSEEEYAEALAKLNKSKSSREKSVVKEQKQRKRSMKASISGRKHSKTFIQKCKEDIVIPICLLSMVIVTIGIVLYFILPTVFTKSLGMNIDELRSRYTQTTIYNEVLLGYNFEIPEVNYIVSSDTSDVDGEDTNASNKQSDKYNYFSATIPNTATSFATGIQGSTRKIDNKIVSLRVITEYQSDESYYNFMCNYFASYVQTIYPDLTKDEAIALVENTLEHLSNGVTPYLIKENYAYRIAIGNDNGIVYVAMDFVTADKIT